MFVSLLIKMLIHVDIICSKLGVPYLFTTTGKLRCLKLVRTEENYFRFELNHCDTKTLCIVALCFTK